MDLELAQFVAGLRQMEVQALQLPREQIGIKGHDDGAGSAEDLLLGAINLHLLQSGMGERVEAAAENGQQIGVLRRHQGADEVKGRSLQLLEASCAVIAFVE